MPFYLSPPPQNPVTRLFTAIVAVLVMVGSFMVGLVALAVVVGLALVIGLAAWLRIWWIRRRPNGGPGQPGSRGPGQSTDSQVLETEYTVVSRKQDS